MKKLLFVRHKTNHAISEGGTVFSDANLGIIYDLLGKSNVDEYAVSSPFQKKTLWAKIRGIINYFIGIHSSITQREIAEIVRASFNYEIVFLDRSVFGYVAKKLRKENYKGEIITLFHNFEPIFFRDSISDSDLLKPLKIACVRKNERWSCRYSDKIIALNQRDGALIQKYYNKTPDFFIPILMKDKFISTDINEDEQISKDKLSILFFGAYFAPNNEGILWFVREVFPHIDVHLKIVGKGMSTLQEELPMSKNIELLSDVPDLSKFINEADMVILPIFKGSGMKVKTCEALMYGKNIIATNEAFEGYELDYEKVGALANSKEDFVAAFANFRERFTAKFNSYSRQYYLENHSVQSKRIALKTLFDGLDTA